MSNRTKFNQSMVEAGIASQREYVRLRNEGKTQAEASNAVDIEYTSSSAYEAMYTLWGEDAEMIEQWWADWLDDVPTASHVPRRAYSFLAARRRAERKAAKCKHSNAGQGGPVPTFTPAEIPARASLATIDELRTDLARWRGKARAAYNILNDDEMMTAVGDVISDAESLIASMRILLGKVDKIRDLLDMDKEGNDDTK